MDIVQDAVALLIVVFLPILDLGRLSALRRGLPGSARTQVYRRGVAALWLATAAACAATVVVTNEAGWRIFLMRSPVAEAWVDRHRLLAGAAVLAICVFFLVTIVQGWACHDNAARRRQVAPAFAHLRFLLPVSRLERRWWIVLSLSAGICEEILYRGFVFHVLLDWLPGEWASGSGLVWAWLLSALGFGVAHLYQGWRGMLASVAMGLVFGLLAIGTGSLLLPIALHAVLDLQILWMHRPDLDEEPGMTGFARH